MATHPTLTDRSIGPADNPYHPADHSFILKGNFIYSEGPKALITRENAFLVCTQGISQGLFDEVPETYRGLPFVDCGDSLIIPGMTDLHVHAPQFPIRALGLDEELIGWLDGYAFPEEARYRDLCYAEGAYETFVREMTHTPNTRACIFATCHVPATLLLMDKLEASGHVTCVGKVNMDRHSHPDLQEGSAEASLSDTRRWLQQTQGRFGRTMPILTPRFIPSCTDELLLGLGRISREMGVPIQSHLSENLAECDWVKALCPSAAGYGDAYARFDLFGDGNQTVMAHCVWSPKEELALMKARGVFIAHCPASNANIASGIAPLRRQMDMGLSIGLGSDVAGGGHVSLFKAMVMAIQVSKLAWRLIDREAAPLTLKEAFYLATLGGGAFFGKVGSFAPGYELDAVILEDRGLYSGKLSLEERLAKAVYLSDDRHIKGKYARGYKIL